MQQLGFVLALVFAAVATSNSHAQTYPSRPIRLVVPFPAGGGVDTMARIVGNKLSERIGQPVLVEHRPGAGGTLGADAVAKAAPDGYTVLLTVNALAISASLYRTLPFDPLKAFEPVVQVAANPFVLVGSPKMQAATIHDVIARARRNSSTRCIAPTSPGLQKSSPTRKFQNWTERRRGGMPKAVNGEALT